MVASRFAPHLEKCMGMGRNSSRVASKRIANSRKSDGSDNEADNDDANDNDWTAGTVSSNKKNKKIRRGLKNGEGRGESPSGSSKHSGGSRSGGNSKKARSKQDEDVTR